MLAGPVVFAGHSLGGSLAKLVAAHTVVNGVRPAAEVRAHTYGSPPPFSASCGAQGSAVLEHLGFQRGSIRNWVLDYDPVPRAMISADPYYQLAMRSSVRRS